MGSYVWSLICCGILSVVSSLFSDLAWEARAGLLLMVCDNSYLVSPTEGAVGWSAVCDYDNSWFKPLSLIFALFLTLSLNYSFVTGTPLIRLYILYLV